MEAESLPPPHPQHHEMGRHSRGAQRQQQSMSKHGAEHHATPLILQPLACEAMLQDPSQNATHARMYRSVSAGSAADSGKTARPRNSAPSSRPVSSTFFFFRGW